jgi:hypothetical protein
MEYPLLLAALLRADPAILPSDDYSGYFGRAAVRES